MRTKLLVILAFVAASIVYISCKKEGNNSGVNKARLQVSLTDAPGDFEAVLIDVKDVRINFGTDTSSGWESLAHVNSGQYDLLKLVNDDDTVLADAEISTGTIRQIRLVLGSENFVKIDGQLIKLETPSAQQSGLKLNIHQDVSEGILYKLLLDFDAAKSIHKTGNGKYMLKPVIRTVMEAVGGSIKGWVLPDTLTTAVLAIKGPDTVASTFASSTGGGYLIKGLAAGSYTVHFVSTDTTFIHEQRNATVTTGIVTVIDTVHLHQ
jgi:hypothetical protein